MALDTAETVGRLKMALATLKDAWPGAGQALGAAERSLDLVADRLARPHEPFIVAMCGPTGAGKSHLFNYLAGGEVSPSGYRRPSTIAPVLAAPPEQLYALAKGGFLPKYAKVEAGARAAFASVEGDRLYLVSLRNPPWDWPAALALVDTPDFDSVRAVGQVQAGDMAARADALVLVTHQAKYGDQSTWDFLAGAAKGGRPLLVVLNRVTAQAAVDDFKERLAAFGLGSAPFIAWPEEAAVGQVAVESARRELVAWLSALGPRGAELTAASARAAMAGLSAALRGEALPALGQAAAQLRDRLAATRRVTAQWMDNPREHVSLNLPREARETILRNIGEAVRRSDLWAKPRRVMALPFSLAGRQLKKLFGQPGGAPPGDKVAPGLDEASRESLVASVRSLGRALAEASGLTGPGLDLPAGEIRQLHQKMAADMDQWLKSETETLLAGLPLGQKAAFYLVQFMHIGLVLGLQIQTGGLPGTEVLVGGALGPVISKLTGAVISHENLADFEARAQARHQQALAAVFMEQSGRYESRLAAGLERLSLAGAAEAGLAELEGEAARLWG